MTRGKLLEILCGKFPELDFSCGEDIWGRRINSKVSRNISFFTYHKDNKQDESAIWYLSIYYPEKEIMIPNEDTELFLDYISDIILDVCKIESLYSGINSKINRMESVEWKRDWKLGKVLD